MLIKAHCHAFFILIIDRALEVSISLILKGQAVSQSRLKQGLIIGVAVSAIAGSALAISPNASTHAQDATGSTTTNSQTSGRLADAKLKACQNRQTAINNIMSRIASRGQRQLDVFNKIAERVEAFYTSKGKTLSNYDALVADVTAKKAAAQTALDAVKTSSVAFKCDGTDPKGAAASFKDELKSEIAALKAYKTAIRNLIVGVKSVQGTTTSTTNKTQGGQQ
jgi:putative heme degradation protein